MLVSIIQCDTCCYQYRDRVDIKYGVQNLPSGWFTLIPGQSGGFKETMHFCSIACVRDHATKEANPIRYALEEGLAHEGD